MDYVTIILSAAKAAHVSGSLLLAICSYETNLKNVVVEHDGGSPSYGICQVKYATAQMLGFKGKPEDLMNVKLNAKFAAKYLKYQEKRYFVTDNLTDNVGDWCKLAAAYNAGSYNESKKMPGKPRNLKYVKRVQAKLDESLRYKMSCDYNQLAEAN